ncbi:hypothetical protein SAMN04487938_2654 [Lysobacter sp. cf310]|nr:hypothetical protein SAMN04487938_2654 [Lysobacter sp. cf310]
MKQIGYRGLLVAALLVLSGQALAGDGGGDYLDHETPLEDVAAPDRFFAEHNGVTGQTFVYVGNGDESQTVLYDRSTDRLYISNSNGTGDYPLAEAALSYAGGNLQLATEVANQIRTYNNWGGSYETFLAPTITFAPPRSTGGACDLSPCGPGRYEGHLPPGEFSKRLGIRGYDPNDDQWYNYLYTPTEISNDKRYFEIWREGECDDATDDAVNAITGIAGAAVSCPFVETGVGAVGCAGSAVQVIRAFSSNARDNCRRSTYRGPGRWGN